MREEIRETLARYTWFGDFGDAEGLAGLFTPDGVLEVKGQHRFEGRDQIRDMVRGILPGPPPQSPAPAFSGPLRHHVSSVRIELDSREQARSWSYFLVMGKLGPDHWGRYSDELVAHEGRWIFQYRRASIDGATPSTRWATADS